MSNLGGSHLSTPNVTCVGDVHLFENVGTRLLDFRRHAMCPKLALGWHNDLVHRLVNLVLVFCGICPGGSEHRLPVAHHVGLLVVHDLVEEVGQARFIFTVSWSLIDFLLHPGNSFEDETLPLATSQLPVASSVLSRLRGGHWLSHHPELPLHLLGPESIGRNFPLQQLVCWCQKNIFT